MITPEEERRIIDKAKEEILLTLPKVWSSLFVEMKAQKDLKEKFFKDNKDLVKHENAVSSIFSKIAGENPNMEFDKQAEKALPLIRERIKQTENVSMETPNESLIPRDFEPLSSSLKDVDNGVI